MAYGPFSLVGATDADFSAIFSLDTEMNYDWFWILASADGSNFYGNAWSGSWPGSEQHRINLGSVSGLGSLLGDGTVWVALVFNSDGNIQSNNGVIVDEVLLRKCTSGTCAGSAPQQAWPTGVAQRGAR